jgi:hypothetical protein
VEVVSPAAGHPHDDRRVAGLLRGHALGLATGAKVIVLRPVYLSLVRHSQQKGDMKTT